ncbi:MAG: HIT family protein [Eubacteriales bacterium]|nr:HIT family protein [Eubacteriales bacterium]
MKKDDCIFCKIANGEIPSNTVYEDERFRAILDLSPAVKGHTLIIPKDHFDDLLSASDEVLSDAVKLAKKIGNGVKEALGCDGINVVQNNGEAAGQTVHHLHIHIIPRYADGEKIVTWPQLTSDPEEQAKIAASIAGKL